MPVVFALFVIVLVLVVSGYIALRLFKMRQIQAAASQTHDDPILSDLRPGIPAIVYFTYEWCQPCKTMQEPALERLKDALGNDIQVVQIDAEEQMDVAKTWHVKAAPTTFVLDAAHKPLAVNNGYADEHKLKRQLGVNSINTSSNSVTITS